MAAEAEVALILDVATLAGWLERAGPLGVVAEHQDRGVLTRIARALDRPASELRPRDFPRTPHALAALQGIGHRTLKGLVPLLARVLSAAASVSPAPVDAEATARLQEGLSSLAVLFDEDP